MRPSLVSALLVGTVVLAVHATSHAARYEIIELGPYAIDSRGYGPNRISQTNTVIGSFSTDSPMPATHPMMWFQGTLTDLGTLSLAKGDEGLGLGISPTGQYLVGASATDQDNDRRAFAWSQTTGMIQLDDLDGRFSSVLAITDAGQAVGQSETLFTFSIIDGGVSRTVQSSHAMCISNAFNNALSTDMGALGIFPELSDSAAVAINGSDLVVGWSKNGSGSGVADPDLDPATDAYFSPLRAVRWQVGLSQPVRLGPGIDTENEGVIPGHDFAAATDVGDDGYVVGYSGSDSGQTLAFSWQTGEQMTALPTLSTGEHRALGVNNLRSAVGYGVIDDEPHAVIWNAINATAEDLNDLVPAGTDWHLLEARDINDFGHIVGIGYRGPVNVPGARFGFMLIPRDCLADFNCDYEVDFFDLLDMLDRWFDGDADINSDGTTDFFDLLDFLDAWFTGC